MPENETPQSEDDAVSEETSLHDSSDEKIKPKRKLHNMDNLIKRDMAFLQKKLAELEIAVSEVQEGVQKIDISELSDLKQRLGDIEDLTMVENAAVIELKKMLEGTTAEAEQAVAPQLEERLTVLEQKISGITIPSAEEIKSSITSSLPAADAAQVDEKINEIRSSFESIKTDLESKIDSLQQKFAFVENNISQAAPTVELLKEDVIKAVAASLPDTEWIKNELHSFRSYLDAEKVKLTSLTEHIEKNLETPLPERAVQELEKIRNDWLINMAKIDGVEKFVENFSNEINQLKPVIKKLETFEKLMDLQTEITEKLDAFKEYRDHIEDAMAKNEETERRIQREVSKVKNTEKMFSQIDQSLSVLSKEMERNKREMEDVVRPLEVRIDSVTANVKDSQDIAMTLDKRLDSIDEMIAIVQDDMSVLQGTMMALEGSLSKIPEEDDKLGVITSRMNELQNRVESIRMSTTFDEQLSEIVSRLVFLESRLVAMESVSRMSAIVVE